MPVGDTQVVKVGSPRVMQIKKREAQDRVLALLAQGLTIAVAMSQVDRTRVTFHKWCREEDWFKNRADAIRTRGPEEKEHAFVDFRLVYFGFDTPSHQQKIVDVIESAEEGSINVILLPPGAGKGLALDTPIPTPDGWTLMGALAVGDEIYAGDGSVTKVIATSEIHNRDCYRVTFRNGSSMVADDEHLWFSRMIHGDEKVRSTEAMYKSKGQFRIPVPAPLVGEDIWLPLDPYLLGIWLGDGATNAGAIATADPEVVEAFRVEFGVKHVGGYCYSVSGGLTGVLKDLGVFGAKHIPPGYLRAPESQRIALMQGLMDSDGYVDAKKGRCEFTTTRIELRDGFMELARSLGMRPRIYECRAMLDGAYVGQKYRVELFPRCQIFRLPRKAERLSPWLNRRGDRNQWETIIDIEPVDPVPTRCIAVDHPDKLYVAGKQMLVTHNTTVLEDYYNFKLAHDPNHRFCVISESQYHSRKILGHVANRMVDRSLYPAYVDNFGPFKASGRELQRPWGADAITHVQSNSGERDYSLEAKGAGTAIYGGSFDDIVLDDIQSREKLSRTEGLMEYFQNTLYSRVMRANTKGRIFIVGTRQGQGDFYEELLKLDVVTQLVKIPALDEHGHSYYPRRKTTGGRMIGYSEDELAQTRKVVGEEAWARQHMQEPYSRFGQTFTPSMIEPCLDEKRAITSGSDPMAPGVYRIAALDPALAGHSVFRVAGFDYQRLYLLDGKNVQGLARFEDMWDIIEELTIKWHPQVWIIEGNAIQGGIARSDRIKALAEKYGFTITAHQTGRNKQDDQIGVASMAGTFLRGEISIPWMGEEARGSFAILVDELKSWRADVPTRFLRQDEVMCLWFIHLHWQRMRAQLASRIDRRVHTQGLPWKPSSLRSKVPA